MKVAVLAPARPDLHEIRRIRELCSNLLLAGTELGHALEVTLGLPVGGRQAALTALRDGLPEAVLPRTFQWEPIPSANAARMFPGADFDFLGIDHVHVPRDWGWNFRDADVWIVHADAAVGAILPLRPTFLFVRDVAERYIVSHPVDSQKRIERFLSWRQVSRALVYDAALVGDLVSFVGMQSRKAFLFGPTVPCVAREEVRGEHFVSDVFCFSAFRDDATLRTAAEGVLHFVQRNPEASVLVGFDGFSDPPEDVADRIRRFSALIPAHQQGAVRIQRFESEFEWGQAMRAAQVVMSPRVHPGEPDDLLTALAFSKPFVGLGTPQSRRIGEIAEGGVFLYRTTDAREVGEALAQARAAAHRGERPDQAEHADLLEQLRRDALASTVSAFRTVVNTEAAMGADDAR